MIKMGVGRSGWCQIAAMGAMSFVGHFGCTSDINRGGDEEAGRSADDGSGGDRDIKGGLDGGGERADLVESSSDAAANLEASMAAPDSSELSSDRRGPECPIEASVSDATATPAEAADSSSEGSPEADGSTTSDAQLDATRCGLGEEVSAAGDGSDGGVRWCAGAGRGHAFCADFDVSNWSDDWLVQTPPVTGDARCIPGITASVGVSISALSPPSSLIIFIPSVESHYCLRAGWVERTFAVPGRIVVEVDIRTDIFSQQNEAYVSLQQQGGTALFSWYPFGGQSFGWHHVELKLELANEPSFEVRVDCALVRHDPLTSAIPLNSAFVLKLGASGGNGGGLGIGYLFDNVVVDAL